MNALQLYQLKKFCEKYDIDEQEIDESLTYYENKDYLEQFLIPESKEERWIKDYKSYLEYEASITLAEESGFSEQDKASKVEVKRLKYRAIITYRWFRVKHKSKINFTPKLKAYELTASEVLRAYLGDFACPFKEVVGKPTTNLRCGKCPYRCPSRPHIKISRNTIKLYAVSKHLTTIMFRLDEHGIRTRVLKLKLITRGYQFISGLGWVNTNLSENPQ